jgi:Luciferase-like monooxygenase
MDAGVHLPLIDFGGEGFSYRRLAETVDAARGCGFAAISANDHFLFPAPWLDGPTALAGVAGRSGEMALVTTLALATLRGPVPLAKALSALDIISGGRMIAGLGPVPPRPTTWRWGCHSSSAGSASTRRSGCSGPFSAGDGRGRRLLLPRAGDGAVPAAAAPQRDPAVARELGLPSGPAPRRPPR